MPTTMKFTLSSALQQQLNGYANPYVFALEYAGGQFVPGGVYTIASPGNIPTGQVSISLPSSFASGQVFVVVAPNGNASLGTTISTTNNGNVNAITPANALANGYQYQLLEATLTPSPGDLGDVSSVNTFAFPATMSDANGTRGFASGVVGTQIQSALNTIAPGSLMSNGLAIGPAQSSSLAANPWPSSDWTAYVTALTNGSATALAALSDMQIVTYYGPGPTLSQYSVSFSNGYFIFTPNTMTGGANNTDFIRISTANLQSSIYAQTGVIEISTDGGNTYTPTTTFTPNTADGTIAQHFVAGFDANYWGGSGTSPNPADPSVIDLNKTWNWNYNYAYDATLNAPGSLIKYTNTLGSGIGTAGGGNRFYDPWAQIIQGISNTYGWSYGDLISAGGTNPQISLWANGAQVPTIDVTLYSPGETIPSTSGYIGPPPAYVAPPPAGTGNTYSGGLPSYFQVNKATLGQNVLSFATSFGPNNMFSPNSATPTTLKFYAPNDAMADKTTGFVSLSVTDVSGSSWNVVGVRQDPTTLKWSLVNVGAAPPNGDFTIYDLPVTSNGSTGWYQIVFGASGHQTTYNIYATSSSSGAFLPILGTGANPNNFVVDHGLGYGPGAGVSQNATGLFGYALNFAPSGSITYDIATFSAPSTMFGTRGPDVLNGTGSNDIFNAANANDIINGAAGIDTAVSWFASKNFTLRANTNSSTITLQDKVGTDGTDALNSIERIQFKDQTLDTTWITKTLGLTVPDIMKVVDLYTAGLNRAPDALGLDYWAARLADGAGIGEISKAIFGSAEAAPIYGLANSNPVFVSLAYQTALGRAPDAAAADFWLNELQTGHIQRSDFVTALIASVRGTGGSASDAQYIANKEAVGAHFALTAGLNNATWARTVESAVTGSAASVTAANAQTDAFAVAAAAPATSEFVVQITGIVP
jgi:hypothetical protein